MRGKIWIIGIIFVLLAIGGLGTTAQAQGSEETFFSKSLHYDAKGMRHWYEKEDGFMSITRIPYEQLDCKNCHASSCDKCHAKKEGEKFSYSIAKAKDMETCLTCHKRSKVTFDLSKTKGSLDHHIDKGMTCLGCHTAQEIHGDGTVYHSKRDEGAVKASCKNCHSPKEDNRAHKLHRDKLHCSACHVSNSISCLNCHLDSVLKTGTRKGNFFPPIQDWVILVNYKGKVTAGTAQTYVYKNNKFLIYSAYTTHAIQKKGRQCADCHANPAVKLIQDGKSVPMAVFKDNKMDGWKGVVPLVPDKLEWAFLSKDGDKWVPIQDSVPPKILFVCYAEPLTKEQLKKLMAKQFEK